MDIGASAILRWREAKGPLAGVLIAEESEQTACLLPNEVLQVYALPFAFSCLLELLLR